MSSFMKISILMIALLVRSINCSSHNAHSYIKVQYGMARNIGVEQNLAVGEINHVSPNFILPTFNTCINTCSKNSKCLHFNIEAHFLNSTITITFPSTSFIRSIINSTKVEADLAYTKVLSLSMFG